MTQGVAAAYGEKDVRDIEIGGGDVPKGGLKTFDFQGMHWNATLIVNRIGWLIAPLLLVVLAALLFDRYRGERSQSGARARRWFDAARLVPNVAGLRLYRAELALLLNGQNLYWTLGALGIIIAGSVAPLKNVVTYILPIAMIWPVERWSALGCRERRWNVDGLLGCVPHPFVRTTLAQWAAAVTVGGLISAGFLFRLAAAGEWTSLFACLIALGAISAAALACGAVTGSPRLFEGAYLIIWYLGPVNHMPGLDFVSAINAAPVLLVAISAAVLAVALALAIGVRITQPAR